MSKERTSTGSSNEDQTNEDSNVFRQEDNAIREKFASFSDTTLQDIPTEILQCILIKAITMEVKNMKLAKSVWKEKADLVISRLGSVCSQWSSVLTTDFFQIALQRTLDGIAQETIRMDIVQESLILVDRCYVDGIATLKDDIFLFCLRKDRDYSPDPETSSVRNIKVYDRNNMAEVKDVIELSGRYYGEMTACNVSNCVYVLKEEFRPDCASVFRITKDEDQKFVIQSWISDLRWPIDIISVSDEGKIIIPSSTSDGLGPNVIRVYTCNPNGFLHHEVILSRDVHGFQYTDGCVMRKSDGNLVLGSVNEQRQVVLTEIDMDGNFQRKCKSSLEPMSHGSFMSLADASGRILIPNLYNVIELLDSELNLLEFTGQQSNQDIQEFFCRLHFNSHRNEVMGICSVGSNASLLKIFRFVED